MPSFEHESWLIGPGIGLMVVPWLVWLPVRGAARRSGQHAFERAVAVGRGSHAQWYAGSGLAFTDGELIVGSGGAVTRVPFAELVEQRFVPEGAVNVSAAGASGVLGVVLALFAVSSAAANHQGAGLVLTSRSSRRPLQVAGLSRSEAESWMARLQGVAPQIVTRD